MELRIDLRWLLDRQEELLDKLDISDYSSFMAAVSRLRLNTPSLETGTPDAYWRAAALLDTIVLLRPLPIRNELFGYGVAVAYIEASGETVDASYDQWRDLIIDIKSLRLTVFDIADRLRSWSAR